MYQQEQRVRVDRPDLADSDVMMMKQAATYLGVPYSSLHGWMLSGRLTTFYKANGEIASHAQERRYLLRSEVEQLRVERGEIAALRQEREKS